jgi:hypothetical protein
MMRSTQTKQSEQWKQAPCVSGVLSSVLIAGLIATVAASAACGGSPAIVMYDASLEPTFALELRDEGGKPVRISEAFDVDGDVLVTGARLVSERCETGISDGWFGPLPYRECFDIAHEFVARIERDSGDVKWMIAARGDEAVSCPMALIESVGNGADSDKQFRLAFDCPDGVEVDGRSGLVDEWLDVDEGVFAGADPPPVSGPYDDVAVLDDGSVIVVFDEKTERGSLNDDGVIVETLWKNAGHEGISSRGAVHVLDGEVLAAWQDGGLNEQMRLSVLDVDDGSEIETRVIDAAEAVPSAKGWWSTAPFELSANGVVQHRDRTGAVLAERETPSTRALSGTYEELWLVDDNGTDGAAEVVTVTLP